jgi:Ca2+-binding RTX toxin-like protein
MEGLEARQMLSATIDLRTPSGGKAVTVSSVGQVVDLNVWAVVTAGDTDAANDAFQWAHGSFLSSDVGGGAAAGTLAATVANNFAAETASNGAGVDLDGDGDLDVGSNNNAVADGFFVARSGGSAVGGSGAAPARILIGTVKFTVTSLKSGTSTEIKFRPRDNVLVAGWYEDFNFKNSETGSYLAGAPVVVTKAVASVPTAALTAATLTKGGGSTHTFTVRYDDKLAMKASTFDNNDIRVTGPNGFNQLARFISATPLGDGASRTVTYRINAPGAFWDSVDNGTYSVAIQSNQVSNTAGTFVGARTLGTFAVNVPRAVLTADGTLVVNGTNGNNTIGLSIFNSTAVRAVSDGIIANFSRTAVKRISVFGMSGNDIITIGAGVFGSHIDGGAGDDAITGGGGNDNLNGGDGVDRLTGGGGNDWLKGGNGNDNLVGNDGNDRLDGGGNSDVMSGGSGVDTGDYSSRSAAVFVLLDNINNDGQSGELDNLRADVENVWGGNGADRLTGSSIANNLRGGGGNDTLSGGAGNDTLNGGGGADSLLGQDGNDRLEARDGVIDVLNGGTGTDSAQFDSTDKRTSIETVLA